MERCCTDCQTPIGGKKTLRCPDCSKKRTLEAKQKPYYKLWAKWYTMCKRRFPSCLHLTDRSVLTRVVKRWGAKSVISGETNLDLLTVVPMTTETDYPVENDLILVTKKECILLGKTKTTARRLAFIPESVQKRIQNKV